MKTLIPPRRSHLPVNLDKPHLWKGDIAKSVDLYNEWFMAFAPEAFRKTRIHTTKAVEDAMTWTSNLSGLSVEVMAEHPNILPMLRMCTCPPLARDRLIGLADLSKSLIKSMEIEQRIPPKMTRTVLFQQLGKARDKILKLIDPDIFIWLRRETGPTNDEVHRAATIVADRMCGAQSDPIIRNAQEKRQLKMIGEWLGERGYKHVPLGASITLETLPPGSFSFHLNVPIIQRTDSGGSVFNESGQPKQVNIPVDVAIRTHGSDGTDLPLMIECKSAGDFTNTNKRRKEEATKINQLRGTYGNGIRFVLFLCGYFDSGYLGYEAAEGIDWVWEHRIDDLAQFAI